MKVLIATTNKGKLEEFQKMFEGVDVEVVTLAEVEAVRDMDVVEDGKTFRDNAVKKAREYGEKAGMLAIADDTGLMVDALDGRPGVYSKRYGASDEERNEKLLGEMEGVKEKERTARFVAVVVVYDPEDERVYTSEGAVEGKIVEEAAGEKGFGYDPVFFSDELGKTFAEASREEKNEVSHRGRALRELRPVLRELLLS